MNKNQLCALNKEKPPQFHEITVDNGGPEEIPGNACGVPVAWRLKKSSNLFGKPVQ
ncbi:hypothetical protein [Butyricicoccus sp. OM04-18BH]|uniref:hypothetical protein n=1 Tax=Agathobaculum sp. TaxID=2048138 RepID=UPI00131487E2